MSGVRGSLRSWTKGFGKPHPTPPPEVLYDCACFSLNTSPIHIISS
jgi:hypothetical protein